MLFAGAIMLSCVEKHESPADKPQENAAIVMDVKPVTRALIENNDLLRTACDPEQGGQAIGIWSAYEVDGQTVNNVLGNSSGDVALRYIDQTEQDNYQGWTYGQDAAYWAAKAKYTFNAYFPMDVVDEITTSNTSTFIIDYNTEHYQDDLMMAYAYADTGAAGFNASAPVTLNMLHTLAAVRFQFSFRNGDGSTFVDSDRLTACWLENTRTGEGMATTAILAFGKKDDNGVMDGEHIHWYNEDFPAPSTPLLPRRIYVWEDAVGVPFYSTLESAYEGTTHSTGSGLYASNGGWIMIIPQHMDASVQLCFKIASTGDLVHRVALPATEFMAGQRYTFNVRFGQSDVSMTLSIADWNEMKSSYDIAL
jgi:hypothetical protein